MRLLVVALLLVAATTPPRTAPNERASFVTTLGRDTVVVESFTRTNTHIDGDIVVRVPGTVICHYSADLANDGTITHTVVDMKPLGTSDVHPQKVAMNFENGAARVAFDTPGKPTQMAFKVLE